MEETSLDPILDEIGHFGRYQMYVYSYVLLVILSAAVYNTQYIFAAGDVKYRCLVPECESTGTSFEADEWGQWALPKDGGQCERLRPIDGKCTATSFFTNQTIFCSAWVYQANNTIVAEFELACQNWKRTMVGTIHNAGVFVTLPLTAYFSDAYGRRLTFVLTAVVNGVVGLLRSFVGSYIAYIVLEFIEAALGAGVFSTGFILALEMLGLRRRVLGGNLISTTFAIGQVIAALVAWAIPYWRTYLRVIYTPAIFFLLYLFFVEESVRWLLSRGRKKEASRIIFKAAAMNRKQLSPETVQMLSDFAEEPKHSSKEAPAQSVGPSIFKQIIKSKTIVTRLFICSFWWVTITFVYYGLSINSVSLAGNSYVNYILSALVEVPGYFISIVSLDRFGRKRSIITAFFICGSALISMAFTSTKWLQATLSMVGKLAISMIFASIYIYTIELFPTYARHSLMNTCSTLGRLGAMTATQTPLLMAISESLPYLVFGVMSMTSALLMTLTPETLRTRLPDTVQQAENIFIEPQSSKRSDPSPAILKTQKENRDQLSRVPSQLTQPPTEHRNL